MINAAVNGGGPPANNVNNVLASNTIRHANSNIHNKIKSTSSLSGIIVDNPTVATIVENQTAF